MDQVVLRPDPRRALAWSLVGLVATGLAAFAVGSATSPLLATVLLVACAVPTAVFGLQLLAPEVWTLQVDRHGVHGLVATNRVDERFDAWRAVEVRQRVGDAVLVLVGEDRRRALLLPVGCDVDALRELVRGVTADRASGRTSGGRPGGDE